MDVRASKAPVLRLFHCSLSLSLSVSVAHLSEEDFQALHSQRGINSEQRLSKLSAMVSPEINCCCALSATAVTM